MLQLVVINRGEHNTLFCVEEQIDLSEEEFSEEAGSKSKLQCMVWQLIAFKAKRWPIFKTGPQNQFSKPPLKVGLKPVLEIDFASRFKEKSVN